MLDRTQYLPLHLQLAQSLRVEVEKLAADSKFLTEREICDRFGICRATVSKALNELVKDGLVYRVQGKGTFASGKKGNSQGGDTIVMFLPAPLMELFSAEDYIFTELAQGVVDGIARDAHLSLTSIPRDVDETAFCVERISHPATHGIVLMEWQHLKALTNAATSLKKPYVLLNVKTKEMEGLNTILADEVTGARQATQHLISLGHRSILYVGNVPDLDDRNLSITHRFLGYKQALEEAGLALDPALVIQWSGRNTAKAMREAEEKLLSGAARPTAVFAANDTLAVELMKSLQAKGLRVPEDVSVVGYDDAPAASETVPALTTVRKPRYEMGKAAATRMLSLLKDGVTTNGCRMLDAELVVRGSTGSVPGPKEHVASIVGEERRERVQNNEW